MIAVIRGPYSHRRGHPLRGGATGGGATTAAARDELVFGHPHRHRGQVEHLPPLHPGLGCIRQVRAAPRTRAGLMPLPLIRIVDQRQRRPRMPGLPARLLPALAPQRLRSGLGKRRVRRRRPRRVPAVLPQLPRQFSILGPHLSDLSLQPLDQLSLLHNKSSKLIRRTPIVGHHNMIDKSEERSNRHAVRHLMRCRSGASAPRDSRGTLGVFTPTT
jgi:hypothetical protein